MNSNPLFLELIDVLQKHKARFLIVGGYAVMKYGEPRFTKDIDIFISIDDDNPEKVFNALAEFGAPLAGLSPLDFSEKGHFYKMGFPPHRVDILMSLKGINFDKAWEERTFQEVSGRQIPFISLQHLITNKNLAGRPKDLLDAENLQRILDSRKDKT